MSYKYIKATYGLDFKFGEPVVHTTLQKYGRVRRERPAQSHYVYVLFDGESHAKPCHPQELMKVATGLQVIMSSDDEPQPIWGPRK